jgi:hypothetical protein
MDGSLSSLVVTVGDAATTSFRPMTPEHVDMLRARVEVVVRCKIPIGGRVVCALAGGSGFGHRPSAQLAAESVFPVQAARAEPAAACADATDGSGSGRRKKP